MVDNLCGDVAAGEALDKAADRGDEFAASVLTKVEVLAGMRSNERKATRALLDALAWVEVDDEIGEQAGGLARRLTSPY